ncbi:chromosome partition protein Smc-like [Cebidichthys violaceus]|uniref:chromosome partition protein Smc-like n=1 Tax=Cebidichthys violaceus TaxID=271503 RepID=UPI0035CA1F44
MPGDLINSDASSAGDKLNQSSFTPDCIPMGVTCGSAGLVVGVLITLLAVCWNRKRENDKQNKKKQDDLTQKVLDLRQEILDMTQEIREQGNNQDDLTQDDLIKDDLTQEVLKKKLDDLNATLMNNKSELDKMKDLLQKQLDEVKKEKWEKKSVETETERQLTSEQRQNLLDDKKKWDEIERTFEILILMINQMLGSIESQVTKTRSGIF